MSKLTISDNAITIGYARVSSHDQKSDLETQKQVLELFCAQHGWQYQVIEELGSGLNYSKRGLQRLIRMITDNQTAVAVIKIKKL